MRTRQRRHYCATGSLLLQSGISMMSAAEVTSRDSWCSSTQGLSAFRRLGCARLRPVSTRLRSTSSCSNSDDLHHITAVRRQQRDDELIQETTGNEETNEDSGVFDCTPPCTAVNEWNLAAASSCDRIANVSVQFPYRPSAAQLAGKLRAAQRNGRRIVTTTTISPALHHSSLNSCSHVTLFDVLPDAAVSRVLASGLDSCDLCRCGLVCRRWHALVWNDSRLWATIDFGCHETLDVDNALRTVTRALSRTTPRLCLGVHDVVLGNCQRLTDDGLRTVAKRCVDLRRLDVSSCTLITNAALFDVLSRCVNLQHLNVAGIHLSLSYNSLSTCLFGAELSK